MPSPYATRILESTTRPGVINGQRVPNLFLHPSVQIPPTINLSHADQRLSSITRHGLTPRSLQALIQGGRVDLYRTFIEGDLRRAMERHTAMSPGAAQTALQEEMTSLRTTLGAIYAATGRAIPTDNPLGITALTTGTTPEARMAAGRALLQHDDVLGAHIVRGGTNFTTNDKSFDPAPGGAHIQNAALQTGTTVASVRPDDPRIVAEAPSAQV